MTKSLGSRLFYLSVPLALLNIVALLWFFPSMYECPRWLLQRFRYGNEDIRGLRLLRQVRRTKSSVDSVETIPQFWPEFPLTPEQCENATFVTSKNRGRLGNTIAEYITVFSYGRKHGKIPVLSGTLLEDLLPLFPHLTLRRENETGCHPRNWTEAAVSDPYGLIQTPWNDTEFVKEKDVFLTRYPFDGKLYHEFRRDWMPEFKFDAELMHEVRSFFSSLSAKYGRNSIFIGIHVRRTDQIDHNRHWFCAEPVSAAYYRRAMEHFGLLFPNVVFVLTSDEMDWCKENIRSVDESMPVVFVEGRGRDFDFALLSNCDHSIVSVGTFSYFSAYFAGGLVVAPKIVSEKPQHIDFQVSQTGLENWIFVNND
ncbi:unnamed protein product [Darwinula stevensoni]|uniref:L-Fucosyltransferase n=1 Tax=Darwinula stevensoni TaxID=69355 RepID=A0A7R9AC14_9CRUS|nr:unnamed protein product [Darwinula stevensoni]CAG0899699.1 unnamed protein product [Darwinula stevensoni]